MRIIPSDMLWKQRNTIREAVWVVMQKGKREGVSELVFMFTEVLGWFTFALMQSHVFCFPGHDSKPFFSITLPSCFTFPIIF